MYFSFLKLKIKPFNYDQDLEVSWKNIINKRCLFLLKIMYPEERNFTTKCIISKEKMIVYMRAAPHPSMIDYILRMESKSES